jgi:uncharacterized membrane protein
MLNLLFTRTPLIFLQASLWRDEAFSYLMARLPIVQLLTLTARDSNPPLYYLVLKVWMFFAGTSELSLRLVSLLCFWGVLYVSYRILQDIFLFSKKRALCSLLLFIINPMLHYYAFEARMYTMLAFFGMLFVYAIFSRKRRLTIWSIVLGTLTHYFFIFLPLSYYVILIALRDKKRVGGAQNELVTAAKWIMSWVLFVVISHPPVSQSFWIQPLTLDHFLSLPALLLTGHEQSSWVTYPWIPPAALGVWGMIIYGAWFFFAKHKKHLHDDARFRLVTLLVVSLGIPFFISVISLIKPIYSPRYLIFSSASLILLLTVIMGVTRKSLQILFFVLIAIMSITYAQAQITFREKAPLKQTFASIINEMHTGDVVYVTHEYDYHPAQYYLKGKTEVKIFKKTYAELPWYVGKVLIPPDATTQDLPLFPKRAFVVLSDGTYSIQSR